MSFPQLEGLTQFVVEVDAALLFELADLPLDLDLDRFPLQLEKPDLPFDLSLDRTLPGLEQPDLLFDFFFEAFEGWQGHGRRYASCG